MTQMTARAQHVLSVAYGADQGDMRPSMKVMDEEERERDSQDHVCLSTGLTSKHKTFV